MIGPRAALSAALVASTTASAFLLPPSLDGSKSDGEAITITQITDEPSIDHYEVAVQVEPELTLRDLVVPCPGCAPDKDGEAYLRLTLAVTGDEKNNLELNGVPLLPHPDHSDTRSITADVLVSSSDRSDPSSTTHIPLELRGPTLLSPSSEEEDGAQIVELAYGIVALRHGRMLHSSRTQVTLIQDAKGRLAIINLEMSEVVQSQSEPETHDTGDKIPTVSTPDSKSPECHHQWQWVCEAHKALAIKLQEVKANLKSKLHKGRPSHRKGCKGKGHNKPDAEGVRLPTHIVFRPHHLDAEADVEVGIDSYDHNEAHYQGTLYYSPEKIAPINPHARLRHVFQNVASLILHVFVPIVLGVCIGIAAYGVGVMLGCFIVYVWFRFFRGGRRGPYHRLPVIAEEDEDDVIVVVERGWRPDEKVPEDAPPQYEEVQGEVDQQE